MKAVQFKSVGSPDVLEYVELDTPCADAENAVVRVMAASVNPSDVKNVSGHFEHTVPPRVPDFLSYRRLVKGTKESAGKR